MIKRSQENFSNNDYINSNVQDEDGVSDVYLGLPLYDIKNLILDAMAKKVSNGNCGMTLQEQSVFAITINEIFDELTDSQMSAKLKTKN